MRRCVHVANASKILWMSFTLSKSQRPVYSQGLPLSVEVATDRFSRKSGIDLPADFKVNLLFRSCLGKRRTVFFGQMPSKHVSERQISTELCRRQHVPELNDAAVFSFADGEVKAK